jgi:NAD+ kinase
VSSSSLSKQPEAQPVRRIAVVLHGKPETIGDARRRLEQRARDAGVEVVADVHAADLLVALGGDGTMLRALRLGLPEEIPVAGFNFGRVGFLTTARGDELEEGLERIFAGDFRVVELATLSAVVDGERIPAVNDVVVTSGFPGRMVALGWEIGGEDLGEQPCDGMITATPTGSTAYNLSNGGPVMIWGLDAMAITFVAPHSLHARPLVVPRGLLARVVNRTLDVPATVIVDGHPVHSIGHGEGIDVGLGPDRALLALFPEVTFMRRYHEVFP